MEVFSEALGRFNFQVDYLSIVLVISPWYCQLPTTSRVDWIRDDVSLAFFIVIVHT